MTDQYEPVAPPVENASSPDGIPVDDLVQRTRAFIDYINKITNQDRQRLAADLNESGHQRSIQSSAPYLLQGFFAGKLDLDVELARRYPSPPLLSSMTFAPKPGQNRRHAFAQFSSQDTASIMTIEIHSPSVALEISFLLYSMIGIHFTLGAMIDSHRKRFLELIDRDDGIAFLWTRERWERDYLVFVVRSRFARIYAFGPGRVEAACRLTPDALSQLRTWLAGFWLAETEPESPSPEPDSPTLTW